MPEKTVKRRLQDCDAALASDDGPIFVQGWPPGSPPVRPPVFSFSCLCVRPGRLFKN